MKHVCMRCLLALICLAMSLGVGGVALSENYNVVIPPRYDEVGDFSDGMAAVVVGDLKRKPGTASSIWEWDDTRRYGFIDKTGEEVIPLQYDSAEGFHEGFAAVKLGDRETGKWGFIDKTGKEVVPLQYDEVYDFHDGLARVMVDDGQNKLFWRADDHFTVGAWGFIDKTGKEVVPLKYGWVGDFHDGLAMVLVADGEAENNWITGKKWGFIDKEGKEVVPVIYDDVGEFREGRAAVIKDGMLGFVNETGTVVIPLTYVYEGPLNSYASFHQDVIPIFSEGLASVCGGDEYGRKYGYIDRDGNVVIPFEYDYAAPFSEGLAYVSKGGGLMYDDVGDNGKFGYIDKNGKVVVPLVYNCDYEDHGIIMDWYFSDGFAQVSRGSSEQWNMQYGMIDKTGNIIVPIQYDWVWRFYDGLALVGFGGPMYDEPEIPGLVDETGKEVVAVGRYAYIEDFHEGHAAVGSAGDWETQKWGFIDTTGKEAIPTIFDSVNHFSEGLAAVLIDGKWGYIAIE